MERHRSESRSDLNERATAYLSRVSLPMGRRPCTEETRTFWMARCQMNAGASDWPCLKNLPAGFGYPRCRRPWRRPRGQCLCGHTAERCAEDAPCRLRVRQHSCSEPGNHNECLLGTANTDSALRAGSFFPKTSSVRGRGPSPGPWRGAALMGHKNRKPGAFAAGGTGRPKRETGVLRANNSNTPHTPLDEILVNARYVRAHRCPGGTAQPKSGRDRAILSQQPPTCLPTFQELRCSSAAGL